MTDTVLTLVFSIVMLVFMAFPAMKIVERLTEKNLLKQEWHNLAVIIITIVLSLCIGLFLRFY